MTVNESLIIEESGLQQLTYQAPVAQSVAAVNPGGCESESRLGQLSFRRLTKVNATCVIRLPPMG